MLTMRDCLDYCDLTEEEVGLFAEHEHIPAEIAAPIVCSLVQTDEGVRLICSCLTDLVDDAMHEGAMGRAEHVLHVYAQFRSAHPSAY
ncbi:MAG: hypothetical protein REI09_08980 [Candidatus Dactylopiibacterium sp.]|nr:hypothetical protein [Candidatus Dactylopiibacterium sp.]